MLTYHSALQQHMNIRIRKMTPSAGSTLAFGMWAIPVPTAGSPTLLRRLKIWLKAQLYGFKHYFPAQMKCEKTALLSKHYYGASSAKSVKLDSKLKYEEILVREASDPARELGKRIHIHSRGIAGYHGWKSTSNKVSFSRNWAMAAI